MKKVIVVTMMLVFLWTGVSFAENWIIFYNGGSLNSFFDADRVVKKGDGFDYWTRDTFNPEFIGKKYLVQHLQVELRTGEWWIRILESWYVNSQGTSHDYSSKVVNWQRMQWSKEPHGIALLNGLRKYGR